MSTSFSILHITTESPSNGEQLTPQYTFDAIDVTLVTIFTVVVVLANIGIGVYLGFLCRKRQVTRMKIRLDNARSDSQLNLISREWTARRDRRGRRSALALQRRKASYSDPFDDPNAVEMGAINFMEKADMRLKSADIRRSLVRPRIDGGTSISQRTGAGTTITAAEFENELSVPAFLEIGQVQVFRVSKEMGRGDSSTIQLAEIVDPELNAQLAVSIALVKTVDDDEEFGSMENSTVNTLRKHSRFLQEVALLWYLRDSHYFPRLYGYVYHERKLLMKYYEAGTLQEWIVNNRMSEHNMLYFGKDIFNALKELFILGIVHLDVKPANILLEFLPEELKFRCILADFSSAQISMTSGAVVNKVFRPINLRNQQTTVYSAPELFQAVNRERGYASGDTRIESDRHEHLNRSDQYSAGIIMFDLLTRLKAGTAQWSQFTEPES